MVDTMERRLNVLLVSNLFPTPVDRIRGVFTLQLAKELDRICDLTVVCPLPWFPKWLKGRWFDKWASFADVPAEYEIEGIKVVSPKYPMIPKLSEAVHARLMFPSLYSCAMLLHRKRGFDAINTQWLYPDGVASGWVASRLEVPHVLTALGCDANLFLQHKHKRSQITSALEKADGVTAVSGALAEYVGEHAVLRQRPRVIPNGADSAIFRHRPMSECRRAVGIPAEGRVIVFVGQLLEVKGVIYLIEAVEKLIRSGVQVDAYLVGDGGCRGDYEREIRARQLEGRIRLVGNRPHAEVAAWIGACDVFCLPSIREGFPNVVLEALTCGRPVVASRVGGIPEMVNESNGILVEAGNSRELSDALDSCLRRDWDHESIVSSVAELSWRNAAGKYEEVFRRAVETARNRHRIAP